jgi:hypothetical protein
MNGGAVIIPAPLRAVNGKQWIAQEPRSGRGDYRPGRCRIGGQVEAGPQEAAAGPPVPAF